jgi:hypothetical protein
MFENVRVFLPRTFLGESSLVGIIEFEIIQNSAFFETPFHFLQKILLQMAENCTFFNIL